MIWDRILSINKVQVLFYGRSFSDLKMTFDIRHKTFVITGGASGMGAQYVQKFIDQGAKSIAVLDVAVAHGEALVRKHNEAHPGKVTFIKCDMSKEDEITKAFETAVSQLKQVDVIINNAGVMMDGPEMWRIASDVNWQGLVSLTLKGIKHMSKQDGGLGGTIVNISSEAALSKNGNVPMYCGTKSAVMHFSQCIAMDPFYETTGIRILCMCFGTTDTPLLANLDKRVYDSRLGKDFIESLKHKKFQKVESAIAATDYMIKHGKNGSIWVSVDDKPARDFTAVVNEVFETFEKKLFGDFE